MPFFASRVLCGGFPGGSDSKDSACQCRRHGFDPWVGKILWRRKWQNTLVFLPENSMDRGAWWATVHGIPKSQTQLSMSRSTSFMGSGKKDPTISQSPSQTHRVSKGSGANWVPASITLVIVLFHLCISNNCCGLLLQLFLVLSMSH